MPGNWKNEGNKIMDSPSKAPGPDPGTIERIALVGNPNVGKSVVFGWLTGHVTVSNYPGTTVEVTQGNCKIGGRRRVIVDTPGINNLIPMSEDERVTRGILLEDGDIKVICRHRLAERLLPEIFELEESHMESSACQFEHILSPKVSDSVCTFLGHPPICPHGKPIPRGPCCARFKKEMESLVRPLADLKPGEEGRVVFITPKSRGCLERLSALGLNPDRW